MIEIRLIRLSVYTAVFTVLVFLATVMLVVSTPATHGYFNLGETMVYTAALMMLNPYAAAFAGGVGSALADIYLGYSIYAPGTLVIKAIEGLLVVILIKLFNRLKKYWGLLIPVMAFVVALAIEVYGLIIYSGETIVTIAGKEITIYVPEIFWIVLSVVIAIVILVLGYRVSPEIGVQCIAVLIAGLEMVTGYFIYEAFILGYGVWAAAVEVLINIGQMLIGLIVSVPLVNTLKRMGIKLHV